MPKHRYKVMSVSDGRYTVDGRVSFPQSGVLRLCGQRAVDEGNGQLRRGFALNRA